VQAFRDALVNCQLENFGLSREPFTWKRGRIRERLDHAVENGAWVTMHPGAIMQHLGYIQSDHKPLLLDIAYQENLVPTMSDPRRYEAKWIKESESPAGGSKSLGRN
jgi:hypothetical protein